jgi:pimeloyl-ACP methyl ester carboxylesterase
MVLMSTGVRSEKLPHKDGGHPVMKLPHFMLQWLQPTLTNAFIKMAVHPSHTQLAQNIRQASNTNDMRVAAAYHRHMVWASPETALAAIVRNSGSGNDGVCPVLIVHGAADGVVPLACAEHLENLLLLRAHMVSKLVVIEPASHLVMMEQPEHVATEVLAFLKTIL